MVQRSTLVLYRGSLSSSGAFSALASFGEQVVVADADGDEPIGALVGVEGGHGRVPVPDPVRADVHAQGVHQALFHHREGGIEHGDVDGGALAGAVAADQSGDDSAVAEDAAQDVGDGGADPGGAAVFGAGSVHDPGDRLDDGVVGGLLVHGTVLAEPGDGADDQPRVLLDQVGRVQAEPGHDAGPEILDHHVGPRDHRLDQGKITGVLQVQGDAFLAEVREPVVLRDAVGGEWSHQAGVVAGAGTFDLDDPGAGVGEHASARRAGQDPGEIDDRDAVQGQRLVGIEVALGAASRRNRSWWCSWFLPVGGAAARKTRLGAGLAEVARCRARRSPWG